MDERLADGQTEVGDCITCRINAIGTNVRIIGIFQKINCTHKYVIYNFSGRGHFSLCDVKYFNLQIFLFDYYNINLIFCRPKNSFVVTVELNMTAECLCNDFLGRIVYA